MYNIHNIISNLLTFKLIKNIRREWEEEDDNKVDESKFMGRRLS